METKKLDIDRYGNPLVDIDAGREAALRGHRIDRCVVLDEEEVEKFNKWSEKVLGKPRFVRNEEPDDLDPEQYHIKRATSWDLPEEFANIDIKQFILDKCETEAEVNRVTEELKLFEERDLLSLLRFLNYLVHILRKNKIVWGVGRGSSVASYVLYLLGVHKVNSIKYELPIEEFLK